jgi:hypothetical protein
MVSCSAILSPFHNYVVAELAIKLIAVSSTQLCLHYVRLIAFVIYGMKTSFTDFLLRRASKMFCFIKNTLTWFYNYICVADI